MTDRTKFEAMLEALINEDHEAAKDIFHKIVVAKSREIYENLLSEEFEEETDDEDDSEDDAFGSDDDEDDSEDDDMFGADDDSEEDDDAFGDEGEDDSEDDFFGDEDEEDGDLENRVLDLEDALDELKSEFEQLLAGEEDEPEHDDMFGGDDLGGDEFGDEEDEFGMEKENEFQSMFEYVNKVALPVHGGGDGDKSTKSLFNKPKYNDMGGTTANIAKSFSTEKGGTEGGLLKPSTTKMDGGNVNVPGNAKAPKLKTVAKGHGAEKAGSRETAPNTRSILVGRK